MSEIPNLIGSFEIFTPKKIKWLKNQAKCLSKTFQKVGKEMSQKTIRQKICYQNKS